jgi:hypothetical protein
MGTRPVVPAAPEAGIVRDGEPLFDATNVEAGVSLDPMRSRLA